jgi:hypothetical protein
VKTLLGGALAASIFFAAPVMAADLSQEPIVVESVAWAPSIPASLTPGTVSIAFRNGAPSAAREITFMVTDGSGRQMSIRDVGTFATDVTIHHDFEVPQLGDGVSVRVTHVEFSNGASWTAAGPAAPLGQPNNSLEQQPPADAFHGDTL